MSMAMSECEFSGIMSTNMSVWVDIVTSLIVYLNESVIMNEG